MCQANVLKNCNIRSLEGRDERVAGSVCHIRLAKHRKRTCVFCVSVSNDVHCNEVEYA